MNRVLCSLPKLCFLECCVFRMHFVKRCMCAFYLLFIQTFACHLFHYNMIKCVRDRTKESIINFTSEKMLFNLLCSCRCAIWMFRFRSNCETRLKLLYLKMKQEHKQSGQKPGIFCKRSLRGGK